MTPGRRQPPPRCFCGNPSKLQDSQFLCAGGRCPFRLRAAADGTPEKPRSRPSNSSTFGERCPCGELVTPITMNPVGLQPGRRYVRCSRPLPQRCQYFRLVETIQPDDARHDFRRSAVQVPSRTGPENATPFFGDRPITGSSSASRPGSSSASRPWSASSGGSSGMGSNQGAMPNQSDVLHPLEDEDDAPRCKCGKPAVKKTVKKEGSNKGKHFFVCHKPMGEQCRFFEWADKVALGINAKRHLHEQRREEIHAPASKKVRQALRHQISLDLEEVDSLSFKLRINSPEALRKAVAELSSAKVMKTNFLGVEKVVVPIDGLANFENHMEAKAETKVGYNIPRVLIDRIIKYRDAEKRREESGDAVKKPLDEILPARICEKLMEFQWHGVHFALKRGGRCLIGDDMGLGKTLQAIAVARVYISDWPLLIVCPSSLRLNWKEELLQWLEDDVEETDILVMMTGRDIDRPLRQINIVSYDLMRKVPPEFLQRCKFIIADESHYLKSMTAQRSKALTPLLKNARRALLLSGTPALSRPVELFPQINAISPVLFPKYQEYVERYCAAHVGRFGYDVSGASNLDELHTLLRGSLLIRRKKEEVLTQLPEKQRQVLWVQTKPKVMKEVVQALRDLENAKEKVNAATDDSTAQFLQNDVKAAQNLLYSLTGEAKVDAVLEFCKDTAETGCKFIVFAHHANVIDAIDTYLSGKLKLGIIRIDGGTAQAGRQQLCRKFQDDKNCRVALLSITAAGVGLTLTKASVVIFAELYWNPGSLLQAEDRAHRIGQRDCVLVKYLLARKTIDESMWGTVKRKLTVVGHSLTGTAARMDVTENQNPNPPVRGSIASFFKSQPKPSNTQGTGRSTQFDDVIEIVDDETQVQPPQGQRVVKGVDEIQDDFGTASASLDIFPTSLREIESSLQVPGRISSAHVGGNMVVDLTDSLDADNQVDSDLEMARQLQEQIDADVALARKLQAQFDAEGVS